MEHELSRLRITSDVNAIERATFTLRLPLATPEQARALAVASSSAPG